MGKKFLNLLLSIVIVCSSFTCLSVVEVSAIDAKIEMAVQWAISIANDDSHGYSQASTRRWGNPDYDCSSLVISALKQAGLEVGGASWTGDMKENLTQYGFTWIPKSQIDLSSSSQLQRGDILWKTGHTEIYIGNNQRVGAHWGSEGPTDGQYDYNSPGDNTGEEINIEDYCSGWEGIFRYNDSENNPQGTVDKIVGGSGTVRVAGWAFDPDDTSSALRIDVYIGGPAGTGEGHNFYANSYRSDVNETHGCGNYHGFDKTLTTSKRGSQPVYVYAINVDEGSNQLIGQSTVTISAAGAAPSVSDVSVSASTTTSFTVSCKVTADDGLSEVKMACWYTSDKENTLKWYTASVSGSSATCTFPISELGGKEGNYTVHIYAYDKSGRAGTYATATNFYNPVGTVDSITNLGGAINIKGWAFDKSDTSKSNELHIYIGGPAGTGEGHKVTANTYRPDVDNKYGCGDYHGVNSIVKTSLTGTQTVYIYSINIGSGGNVLLGTKTVTITADTQKPTISNVKVSDISKDGYTVTCNVKDDGTITEVLFPTWNTADSSNKIWLKGTVSDGVATCKISTDDFDNLTGTYNTHIYAYDASGKYSVTGTSATITSASLSDAEIVDLGDYFISYITNPTADRVLNCPIYLSDVASVTNTGSNTQLWAFSKNSDGTYTIKIKSNDKCLTAKNGGSTANTEIIIDSYADSDSQKWYILKASNGYYLRPKCSNTCVLELPNCSTSEGANVVLNVFGANEAQEWVISDIRGDVNLDGTVNITDATDIQKYIAGLSEFTAEQTAVADYNGDGTVNITDSTELQKVLAGI